MDSMVARNQGGWPPGRVQMFSVLNSKARSQREVGFLCTHFTPCTLSSEAMSQNGGSNGSFTRVDMRRNLSRCKSDWDRVQLFMHHRGCECAHLGLVS